MIAEHPVHSRLSPESVDTENKLVRVTVGCVFQWRKENKNKINMCHNRGGAKIRDCRAGKQEEEEGRACGEEEEQGTWRDTLGLVDDEVLGWQEGWRCRRGAWRPELLAFTLSGTANQERSCCQLWGLLCKAMLAPAPERSHVLSEAAPWNQHAGQ